MADEPRRSGRATKGQHTKIADEPTDTPAAPTKGKGKGKNKQQQHQDEEQEDEDDDGADEQIRCLCGIGEDEEDVGRAFTCCDNCNVWQHNDCMGLPLKYNPDKYFCEQCKPEDHPRIMEALSGGQKAESIAAQNRQEAHSKKKGGRKSKGPRASEVKEESTPAAATPEQNKRKHTSETPSTQPSKLRKASTHVAEDVSEPAKEGRAQTTESVKLADNLSELQNAGRRNTAQALKKKFAQVIKEHSNKGIYRIPDGHTSDSLGERQALVVEYAMFMNHCPAGADPTPAYKNQFMYITSNVGPNPALVFNLIDGSLAADTLSTMSSSDMATDAQKKRDKEIKEENERLAMIKEDETARRRIRRTHKGEEYIDEEGMDTTNDQSIAPPPPRPQDSADGQAASPGAEQPRPPPIGTDRNTFGGQEPSPGIERRSSSNFNIQNVWSSVQSPTGEARPPSHHQSRPSYSQTPRQQSHQNDADLDRLLEDDAGPDSAPYSPTDASSDPNILWRGKVDMPSQPQSIACFDARAYHVAGSNLESRDRLAGIFPREIALGGRIADHKADEYLSSLSAAWYTDVTVHDLVPSANDAKGQAEFNKLFDYLLSRQRYGVVREPHNHPVRDVYIIPLEKGNAEKPKFLQRLVQNIIADERTKRMLLVVFVLRHKNGNGQSAQATPTTAHDPAHAMSPTVSSGPGGGPGPAQQNVPMRLPNQASSATNGGSVPQYQQQTQAPQLPDNPYAPSTPHQIFAQPLYPPGPPANLVNQPSVQASVAPSLNLSPDKVSLSRQILGDYFDCVVAQQILRNLSANPDEVNPQPLQQLRKVFEDHPETRTDFVAFQNVLQPKEE